VGHVSRIRRWHIYTKLWSENLKGKMSLGKPRRRWEENIRMDLREIRWKGVDWKLLALDRQQLRSLVNTAINLRFP
jgi:hypothetical protein